MSNWAARFFNQQSAIKNQKFLRLALVLLQHAIHLLGSEVLMKVIIPLRRRSPAASPNALHFFQRKQTVLGRSLVPNAELLRAVMQNFFAATHQATDVGANLHVELSPRLGGQHGVIAD